MGHAFDPAGIEAINAAVEWALSRPVGVAQSVGWSDEQRFRTGHREFIFRQ
jgi:hypothetical protein